MASWYLMARGWMDHRLLKRSINEPCTVRDAWCWMIENAAWEDHNIKYHGKIIKINRGQLPISLRKMSDNFNWSQNRVRRFIDGLKTDAMISITTDAGFYLITICNYNKYQEPKNLSDAATDARTDAATDARTDANNKKENKYKKENNIPPTPLNGGNKTLFENLPDQTKQPSRFKEFWPIYPRKIMKRAAEEAYKLAIQHDSQENIIAGVKAFRAEFDANPAPRKEKLQFCKHPNRWLKNFCWQDYLGINEDSSDEDDDEMPKNMTPEQHAKWVMEKLGVWRIP